MEEVQAISKELIKPSSPTPHHLRHYKLSFLDQISVPIFMPLVLFYPREINTNNKERCDLIKKSLSEALTHFYPLAGRVIDNMYIDCNDEGAHFVEACAKCTLSDILQNPNPSDLNKLLPYELDHVKDLAAVFQVTFFECGGMAIGFGMSHKPRTGIMKDNIVTKRFVFDASTIAALRAKYSDDSSSRSPRRPTRVEALSAFIWSRFMATTEPEALSSDKIYTVLHAVNLRPRMNPPLQELYFGNISRIAVAVANVEAKENKNYGIVSQMRDAIRNVNLDYVKKIQEGDGHLNFMKYRAEKVMKGEVVSFSFTSLCRFPIYEADFGWGKPVWVGSASLTFKNLVVFLDTKEEDGIEVWINLKQEDMAKFEADKELLAHISPTPNMKISSF
ncbi:hypothetical protein GH714_017631 [Hevea brasiliensis]|uniref:Vinorine synthase-like n=1 Tax=Hevea brasiliensis TaxID=3981 RepID=A0A6A6KCG4_HEVBR|nr:hypothetical protein GH714_017631 [Hevea brasiliensis]